jgi:decaprenylphospho-beta-D-erythro-pentofuranosid-2-ulose 2-reductase
VSPRETVLVVGATSSIARALAGRFAERGARLHLVGRDGAELGRIAADLHVRHGAVVSCGRLDVHDRESHRAAVQDALRQLGTFDTAAVAVGELGDQRRSERDPEHALEIIDANYAGPVSILTEIANVMEDRGRGRLVCLLSVAGERGRPTNYVYGSAKGGLDIFLEGLRARLFKKGVRVTSIRLGFVDTKMTFGQAGLFLVASPQRAAASVLRALDRRRDVAYVPGFWRPVMFAIRSLPRPLFKRMSL